MSTVSIPHFDRGMITTIGGVLVMVTEDGGQRQHYAIACAAVEGPPRFGGKIPVFFVAGSSPYTPKYYPCVVVRRTEVAPAFENGGAWYAIDRVSPAPGAPTVSVTRQDGTVLSGPTRLLVKPRAAPYNITYEVVVHARGDRAMADAMALHALLSRVIEPPGFGMTLEDSAGESRGYDVILESLSPSLNVLDMTERDSVWTWTLVVHGEIDHIDSIEVVSVHTDPQVSTSTRS